MNRPLLLLTLISMLAFPLAASGVPAFLTHQGHILESDTSPVTGSSNVVFKLYTNATGGSASWTQTVAVTFDNGFYSVVLGPGTPTLSADLFDASALYLGITLEGLDEFEPRHRITSVPYALRAGSADTITGEINGEINATDLTVSGTFTPPQGNLGDLPSASSSNNGQLFYATDEGKLYYSNGSAWMAVSGGGNSNSLEAPMITSISPDQIEPGEEVNITISGDAFEDGCEIKFDETMSDSVTFDNSTQVTASVNTDLPSGIYRVSIWNPVGLRNTLVDGLVIDESPEWVTESDLGFRVDASTGDHFTLEATDLEGQTLSFAVTSGALPAGLSLDSETGVISGDPDDVTDDELSTFTVTVSDTARTPNTVERTFTLTIVHLLGAVAEAPGTSCKHILDNDSSQGDGTYWLKPGDEDAFEAYCDMTTDGGGWTLCLSNISRGKGLQLADSNDWWITNWDKGSRIFTKGNKDQGSNWGNFCKDLAPSATQIYGTIYSQNNTFTKGDICEANANWFTPGAGHMKLTCGGSTIMAAIPKNNYQNRGCTGCIYWSNDSTPNTSGANWSHDYYGTHVMVRLLGGSAYTTQGIHWGYVNTGMSEGNAGDIHCGEQSSWCYENYWHGTIWKKSMQFFMR